MIRIVSILALVLLASTQSCGPGGESQPDVLVMSYNLMTLFDPVDQGGEYAEFRVAAGSWDKTAYDRRIALLASAIVAAAPGGPDVLVVQEVENARVAEDLARALGGYAAVLKPEEEAVLGSALLSRYPVRSARAHKALPPPGAPASVPRILLEVELDIGGRALVLYALHWKSKLGGARETEEERMAAAALVGTLARSRRASDPYAALVILGDFNENPDEYELVGGAYPTALRSSADGYGPWLSLYSDNPEALPENSFFCPWEDTGGYSYVYEGRRERIDSILMSPGAAAGPSFKYHSFSAEPPAFLLNAAGEPIRWSATAQDGYSDHLPITLRLRPLP